MGRIILCVGCVALLPAVAWAQAVDVRPPGLPPSAAAGAAPERPAADAASVQPGADAAGKAADAPAATATATPPGGLFAPAQIEQRRTGNRVTEIVVTPAGTHYSYVITNREGQRALSPLDASGGLSLPRFLKLDF
jgi:hypothetical protein